MPCAIEHCPRPTFIVSLQLCEAHYRRMRRHGDPLSGGVSRMVDPMIRFNEQVDRTGSCHLWTGSVVRSPSGFAYGRLKIGGRNILVHRWIYEQTHGPIPPGEKVMHTCDVPLCVTPEHLVAGTQAQNIADCIAKGRAWWLTGGPR